ncbi:uncharacterized protein LOC132755164 isoform X1 [Ruditapes philippinarum]|uniref:uncharacterized protein LOC132755164 isoform X1 n=1 Tax=Ruditapes philippinarum TaxID=129788 RepID=UPI00295B953D|nr:uncharacterized protein LOC132755164 isoform X1 [Ruditapes philippinarum]
MSSRTMILEVLFTAIIALSIQGLTDASDCNNEEFVQRLILLENRVNQELSFTRPKEESIAQRRLSRQVKVLESRVAEMALQQVRSKHKHELLETRIKELEEQVLHNEKSIDKQTESERFGDDEQIEKLTINNQEHYNDSQNRHSRPLEKESSKSKMKLTAGGRIRRSFPENPVAFTAILDHEVLHSGIDQTVVFNKVLLNDGNAYNNHTGVFTVPKEGVYMFYLAFGAGFEAHRLWLHIVVDGQAKVAGVADTVQTNHDAQGTNLVLLHLHKGESVWVSTFGIPDVLIHGSQTWTTFSGVLLYEY